MPRGAEPDSEGDDDAFLRLAGALAVSPVAAQGESYALEHAPGVVVAFAPSARRGLVVHGLCGFHHDVHGALVRLVMLAGVHELEQVGHVVEARLVPADARLVVPAVGVPPGEVHPGDQCREQRAFGGAPAAIVLGVLGGGVDDDVLGQLADGFLRVVGVDVVQGVEVRGHGHGLEVERVHRVAGGFERPAHLGAQLALGVGDDVVHAHLAHVGHDVIPGLAGAGRSDDERVQVPQRGARVEGEAFGAGHEQVACGRLVDERRDVVAAAPLGRSVLLAVAHGLAGVRLVPLVTSTRILIRLTFLFVVVGRDQSRVALWLWHETFGDW